MVPRVISLPVLFVPAGDRSVQQRLSLSHPLNRALHARAVQRAVLQTPFDISGNARHLLLLVEQVIADAEHVHAGPDRLQAGCLGAERLLQPLHLHVVCYEQRIGEPPA